MTPPNSLDVSRKLAEAHLKAYLELQVELCAVCDRKECPVNPFFEHFNLFFEEDVSHLKDVQAVSIAMSRQLVEEIGILIDRGIDVRDIVREWQIKHTELESETTKHFVEILERIWRNQRR